MMVQGRAVLPTEAEARAQARKYRWQRYWNEFLIAATVSIGWLVLSVALGQSPSTAGLVVSTPWLLTYVALAVGIIIAAYRALLHANNVDPMTQAHRAPENVIKVELTGDVADLLRKQLGDKPPGSTFGE